MSGRSQEDGKQLLTERELEVIQELARAIVQEAGFAVAPPGANSQLWSKDQSRADPSKLEEWRRAPEGNLAGC